MARRLKVPRHIVEDIVLYMLEFLHPRDLLTWAQIETQWVENRVLSNDSIWKASLRNVVPPLPPLPDDMSAYEYAVWVFDKKCSVCRNPKPAFLHRFWELRLTICTPCARMDANLCMSRMEGDGDLVPWISRHSTDYKRKTHRAYYDYVVDRLQELQGVARSQFIASCRQRTQAMYNFAGQMQAWVNACNQIRHENEKAKALIKDERRRQVIETVTQMGLGTEARLFEREIDSHRIFWHYRPFGPKDAKLLNQLCTTLCTLRDDRDEKRRLALLDMIIHRASTFKLDITTAPLASRAEDLYYLPELFDLLRQPLQLDIAVSDPIAQKALADLRASDSIVNWFHWGRVLPACNAIVSVTREFPSGTIWTLDSMKRFLGLAVNVFIRDDVRVDNDMPVVHYPFILYPEWRQHPFVFDAYTAANLAKLVISCRLDPRVTPWTAMHYSNARFACGTCTTRGASISPETTIFNWWSAVLHIIKHARGSNRVQHEDLNCVRISPLLQAKLPVSTPCYLVWYLCLICWRDDCTEVSFDTWKGIYRHCMDCHQIPWESARKGLDYAIVNFPPPSKIGRLLGASSEVRITGVHLLKDVAALARGRQVEQARACPVNLENIFGTEELKQMNLFAHST